MFSTIKQNVFTQKVDFGSECELKMKREGENTCM